MIKISKQQTKLKQTEIGMIPEEWEVKELKETASYITEKISLVEINLNNFISTENMLPEKGGITVASSLPKVGKVTQFREGDILFSNIRTYFKKFWLAKFSGGCSNDVLVIRKKSSINNKYLYYYLSQDNFFEFTVLTSKGTKMPRGDKNSIMSYEINIPPSLEQSAIAKILSSLDTKIELNHKIRENLEATGLALFNKWFNADDIPDNWQTKPLDEIAEYLNGLPLQKYPVGDDEEYLPVIKIRELRNGISEQTDKASLDVPENYVIENGDVLFSWSGTLEVEIWTNGKGALNQHLFKIYSKNYPKWFYYYWTKHFLRKFRHIAKGKATTMGHIQRHNLTESEVIIPDKKAFEDMNKIMSPIIERLITINLESRNLERIRDMLLPKLMSGKIRVPVEVKV